VFDTPTALETLRKAIGYFRESLKLDPGYAAAHAGICIALIEIFELSGRPEDITEAESSCATALVSNPNLYVVYAALGDLYRQTNRITLAETAYRQSLERHDGDYRSMVGMADVHLVRNRVDLAEAQLKRAIRVQPGNWRALNSLGAFYFSIGDFRQAADAFRKVVFLDSQNWQALGNLGSALSMTGDFSAAADALKSSLEIHPEQGSLSNLGSVYYYLGEFEKAVSAYEMALELAPRSNVAWMNLADALNFAGHMGRSRQAFERAAELSRERLQINPADTESIETLAWSAAMLGRHDEARELMARAITLAPNDPYAWYYDALVKLVAGEKAAAIAAIETAVAEGYSVVMLEAEPYLAELRDQQRFKSVLARAPGS